MHFLQVHLDFSLCRLFGTSHTYLLAISIWFVIWAWTWSHLDVFWPSLQSPVAETQKFSGHDPDLLMTWRICTALVNRSKFTNLSATMSAMVFIDPLGVTGNFINFMIFFHSHDFFQKKLWLGKQFYDSFDSLQKFLCTRLKNYQTTGKQPSKHEL